MKLTKLERHMAYLFLYSISGRGVFKDTGLCTIIRIVFGISDGGYYKYDDWSSCFNVLNYFPELKAKSTPKEWGLSGYYFTSDEHRKSALKQCIEETADAWPK